LRHEDRVLLRAQVQHPEGTLFRLGEKRKAGLLRAANETAKISGQPGEI
jgi:hypothetical protein